MKAVKHHEESGGEHRTGNAILEHRPVLSSREKHYLVWGILRLTLGVLQMTFAAAAILQLIFVGLTPATLSYAAVATIATLLSRLLFRGRSGPHR